MRFSMKTRAKLLATTSMVLAFPVTGNAEDVDEMVVVGTRTERPAFETPMSVDSIDRDDIQIQQPLSFQEVFEMVPGVEIQGGARRIAEEPSIRGFSDTQVILRVDGARRNFDLAHRGRFLVDPEFVSRIEVVRGAASTIYGSGGLGGAIDVQTVDAKDLLRPGETFGVRLKSAYQTNGQEPFVSAAAFGTHGKVDVLGQFLYRNITEDLEDGNNDPILDTQDRILNGIFKAGYQFDPEQRLELFFDVFQSDGDNPTNAASVSSPSTVVDRDTRALDARLSYSYAPKDNDWIDFGITGFYTDIDVSEDRFIDARLDESDFRSWGIDLKNTASVYNANGVGVDLTLGAEVFEDEQSGTRDGVARTQFPEATRFFAAGYAQAEVELLDGMVDIIPGIRFDYFEIESETGAGNRTEEEVSPRVSVGVEPVEGVYFWGSWAQAFRAPSLTELFVDGTHFTAELAPGQLVINEFVPSPDLLPENSSSFEAGARFRQQDLFQDGDRIDVSGGYFRAKVDDFIDQQVIFISGAPTFIPPFGPLVFPGETRNENVDALIKGVEGEMTYTTERLTLSVSGHLVDGENQDTGIGLASILQNRIASRAEWRWPILNVRAGVKVVATFDRTDVPSDVEPGVGYQTVDLYGTWSPTDGVLQGATFGLNLDNINDAEYSIFPAVIRQPGRSIRLSASYQFGM